MAPPLVYKTRAKNKRRARKVAFCRADLKERGCWRCQYDEHAHALTYISRGKSPLDLAYNDNGWDKIRRKADESHVTCYNCRAIESYENRVSYHNLTINDIE